MALGHVLHKIEMTKEIDIKDWVSDVMHQSPRLRVQDVVQKVVMLELLGAWSGGPAMRGEWDY